LGASIVGINNRDLKTLKTDLSVTERLARLVPADVMVISESGISSRIDADRLASHADAFLVGSSLMAAPDITEAARALVHGRVKLCGLTRAEDVELAARSGATHAGFILVDSSPRAIGFGEAMRLSRVAQRLGIKSVGVFRDCAPEMVRNTALMIGLDAVQLHGRESEADIAAVRAGLPEAIELWAACGVGSHAAPIRAGADRTLFDNGIGGTGNPFDWALLAGRDDLPTAFLAGGIGPANARSAATVGAHGLDVGSSVEASPGVKDPVKVEALFAALRPGARSDA
jgi:indole-3-glycerol phosphate synthase/phosphoribosylanthranilate isomerase